MFLAEAILLLFIYSTQGQTLLGASTLQGQINNYYKSSSFKGGASLYLHINMDDGDPSEFKVFIGDMNCLIIGFNSDGGTLECIIPASSKNFASSKSITVMSELDDTNLSIKGSVSAIIYYSLTATPWILYINPTEACPGDNVAFVGRFYTTNNTLITQAKIGTQQLGLIDIDFTTITAWGFDNVTCTINDNVHGDTGPSIFLSEGFGWSSQSWIGTNYDKNGNPYDFRTIALISNISSNEGSIAGGLNITVEGAGFPNNISLYDIKADGQLCIMQTASYNQIICTTSSISSPSANTVYQGNAGLVREFWWSTANFSDLIGIVEPNFTTVLATPQIPIKEGFNFSDRLYGLFIAPATGNYRFYICSDGGAQVLLSNNSSPSNAQTIISYSSYSGLKDKLRDQSMNSSLISLTEGESYYLEIQHIQYGEAGSHFELGAEMPGPGSNLMPFIQEIIVEPLNLQREIQQITIGGNAFPTGGTLKLKYNGKSGGTVSWTNGGWRCGDILNSINALNISVSCSMKTTSTTIFYNMTFTVPTSTPHAFIVVQATNLTPSSASITYGNVIQKATIALTGTFTVSYNGITSNPMSIGEWSQAMQQQLNELFPTLDSNLIIQGNSTSDCIDYTFELPYFIVSNPPLKFTINTANIQGGGIMGSSGSSLTKKSVILHQPGTTVYYNVIPSDFLRTYNTKSQLTVDIDGFRAVCRTNCNFIYKTPEDGYPSIDSMTKSGTVLTITGNNFDTISGDVTVWIGYGECSITFITSNSILCSIPDGSNAVAGRFTPVVYSAAKGIASLINSNSTAIQVEIDLEIASVSPTSGSILGGSIITITGKGFPNYISNNNINATVSIGNSYCMLLTTSFTTITCETSAKSTNNTIVITVNTITSSNSAYTYDLFITPTVASISKTYGSTITKTPIKITGSNFGTDIFNAQVSLYSETLGTFDCLLTAVTDTIINCDINGGPPGNYTIIIFIDPVGYALFDSSNEFELQLALLNISPISGSIHGGTLITVTGAGFSLTADFMTIFIGNSNNLCLIQEILNDTSLTCLTQAVNSTASIDVESEFILYGRLTDRAVCPSGCYFMFSSSDTPTIDSINPKIGIASNSITISGSAFGTDPSAVILFFGDVQATITLATNNYIHAIVPSSAGYILKLSLTIDGKGYANCSLFNFTNQLSITGVSPKHISQGGEDLVISGSGFYSELVFSIAWVSCKVKQITNESAICTVRSYLLDQNVHLLYIAGNQTFSCQDSTTCGVAFKIAQTSSIYSQTGNLIITGSFPFGIAVSDVTVMLSFTSGKYNCNVNSISSTILDCIPNAPPGNYSIIVHILNYGYANGTLSYILNLTTSSEVIPNTGYSGGETLQLIGSGLYESTIVSVCGFSCEVTFSNGSNLNCTLPPLPTVYSQTNFQIQTVSQMLETYAIISSSTNTTINDYAFDNDVSTYFADGKNNNVYIGIDVGSDFIFQLSNIKFVGGGLNTVNYMSLIGTILQGSYDNITWNAITTFTTVNNLWNKYVVPPGLTFTFRYYRLYKDSASSNYAINEIQIYGILIYNTNTADTNCSITVASSINSSPISLINSVSYKTLLTGKITNISPLYGTIAGGTTVAFTGTGFGTTAIADVSVIIDEVSCIVTLINNTCIICTTGARPNYVLSSLSIFIKNRGFVSTKGLIYLYAERWSDTSTWGGEVPPRTGETAVIPSGMTLIIDQALPFLDAILIMGNVIIEDVPGITINASYIFIYGGTFTIGTEEAPFLNDITITIYGDPDSPALPNYGNKFIACRDGIIDIHGAPRYPSWTMLEYSASKGDISITLQESVNWQPGEQIILATTSYNIEESEVLIIASVSENILTLTTPLLYDHYAATELYGEDYIDMRAEVGLLTRNIKIRGDDNSPSMQYGVHIMLFSPGDENTIGRIENLELFYAGQAYNLGRYPLHFHLIGDVTESYIRNNSIHDTYNRATTVHGVYYLTISNNVAYNTMGHTYFIEDGIESQNSFINNLGITTRSSFSLLNVDQTPATFWITNPSNYIIGNHAVGSDSYGFWYSMTLHPTGPSTTANIWPEFNSLGQFENNVAHSLAKYGLRIFHRFFPSTIPGQSIQNMSLANRWDVPSQPITANMINFTAWKCIFDGAICEDVGDIRFINFKIADCVEAGIETTYTNWTQWYNTTRVQNALIIGNSLNTQNMNAGTVGLLTSQTDGLLVDGAKFHNFDIAQLQYPLADESHSFKSPTRDTGARITQLKKLFFNSTSSKQILWNIPYTGMYEILDDTLTGQSNVFVSAYWPHLLTPECTDQRTIFNSIVCTPEVKMRRIAFSNLEPLSIFSGLNLTVTRISGSSIFSETITFENGTTEIIPISSSIYMQKGGKNKDPALAWNVPFVTGYSYNVHWDNTPVDWLSMSIEQYTFAGDEYVHLVMNFTDNRENFTVSRGPSGNADTNIKVSNLATFTGSESSGTFKWNSNTNPGIFEMIINGIQGNADQFGNITVTAYPCIGNCSTVNQYNNTNGTNTTNVTLYYWSDSKIWPNNTLPIAGSYVEILSSWHLYLDMDTPVIHELEINGILEFLPNVSASLNAEWIFVRAGSIVSGSSASPTPSNIIHSIVLHGNPLDQSFAFNPDVEGGNKVIVVTGNVTLYGYPKNASSYLEQNTYPNDTIIFVTAVDWQVNDTIAIGASSFDPTEYEVFNIIDISGQCATYDQIKHNTIVNALDLSSDSSWIASNKFRNFGINLTVQDEFNQVMPAISSGITKITLSSPIKYFHSGTKLKINASVIDMRTVVVLITRNVQITNNNNGWQYTMVVNDFYDVLSDIPVMRNGFVYIDNVAFSGCGQKDTELACIRFDSVGTNWSIVSHSSFLDSETWAVYLNTVGNLTFTDNIIVNARWRGVVGFNLQNVTINNNIIVRVSQRNYVNSILDASVGFYVCTAFSPMCKFTMINNLANGFDNYGFMMSLGDCSGKNTITYGNKALSGVSGFLYTNNGLPNCVTTNGTVVHFTIEGVGFRSSAEYSIFNNFESVESLVGVSIRTMRLNDHKNVYNTLSNSIFVGRTIFLLR